MRRSTQGRQLAVLVVLASLRGTLAAFGTSKPPDVTYATGAASTASNVTQTVIDGAQTAIDQAQTVVNQTKGALDHVENTVDQLEQAVCGNGVCQFPNGSVFDQVLATTLPPRPTTTQRPTRAPQTKAPARRPTAPVVVPPATAPPVVVTPSPSPSPAPGQDKKDTVAPIDGSKQLPGGSDPPSVQPGGPQQGMPPGVPVGAWAQKTPKEEFDYMPLVWAAVALWSFIVLAIGSALLVQRGGTRPRSESEGQPQV